MMVLVPAAVAKRLREMVALGRSAGNAVCKAKVISDRADELYRLVKLNEAGRLSESDLAKAADRLYRPSETDEGT